MESYKQRRLSKNLIQVCYLLFSIAIALYLFSIQDIDYTIWLSSFFYVIVVQFLFQILFFKLINIRLFSLSGIFLVSTYLFHFGQLIVMKIFPNFEFERINYFLRIMPNDMQKAATFCLVATLMVGYGIILSRKKEYHTIEAVASYKLLECRLVGWILVLCGFPIQLYLDLVKLRTSVSDGYLATYDLGIAGIWGFFGFFSFIGFSLLILGYSKQKKKSMAIFIFVMVYLLLTMITGHRGHQLTIMIFLIYLIHKVVYRINWKKIIIVSVVCYFAFMFINTLATFRSIQDKTFMAFIEVFLLEWQDNVFASLVSELGGTIKTPYLVLQQVPNVTPYGYGKTYPAGLVSIFPNIGGLFSDINRYSYYYKSIRGNALGGSYLGELYYNFSYYGIFFAILVGMFVNKISDMIEKLIIRKEFLRLAYFIPLFVYILWWPRDSFYSIVRPAVWGIIAIFLVHSFVKDYFFKTKIRDLRDNKN